MYLKGSGFFTVEEFECPTAHIVQLQKGFIQELEEFRADCNFPFVVTSGCRTTDHNDWLIRRGLPASPNSLHLIKNPKYKTDTIAFDMARPPGPRLHKLIKVGTERGWSFGIAKTFIHCDLRAKFTSRPRTIYTY